MGDIGKFNLSKHAGQEVICMAWSVGLGKLSTGFKKIA